MTRTPSPTPGPQPNPKPTPGPKPEAATPKPEAVAPKPEAVAPKPEAVTASAASAPIVTRTPSGANALQRPGGKPTDSVFDGFWPEIDLPPQLPLLLGSLGVGALAALFAPFLDAGLALWLVLMAMAVVILARAKHRRSRWTITCAVLAIALVSLMLLRDAPMTLLITLFVAGPVLAAGLTDARRLLAIPVSLVTWPLSAIRGLPLLNRTVTATSQRPSLWPVLRTVAISAAALIVFGSLFASADAIFGSWAKAIVPDISWDSIVMRSFVFVLAAGFTLSGAYLAINPPRVNRLAMPTGRRLTRRWEWLVPAGVLITLFLAFHAAQATAMWSGADYVRQTTGLTYADYVHQGFGQLTVITFLTLCVVALITRKAPRDTNTDRLLLRAVIGVLSLLTLAVVASALYRMHLYQNAFGFTVQRLFVDGFELWLGLLILLLAVAGIRLHGWWLPRAALISGAVFVLGFALMNPDAWVARHNIERYHQTGKIDFYYLSELSADATPAIVRGLPPEMADCALTGTGREGWNGPTGWRSWNLGRARAASAGAGLAPVELKTCAKYFGG